MLVAARAICHMLVIRAAWCLEGMSKNKDRAYRHIRRHIAGVAADIRYDKKHRLRYIEKGRSLWF